MLPEEGPSLNVEVSLVTLKLKERIVAYLENQYRKTGTRCGFLEGDLDRIWGD